MAFTQSELKQYRSEVEDFLVLRRPPENTRSQVDIGCEIDRQSQKYLKFARSGMIITRVLALLLPRQLTLEATMNGKFIGCEAMENGTLMDLAQPSKVWPHF